MIIVDVKEYCQECPDFDPDVEKPAMFYADDIRYKFLKNTIIRCKYRQRCDSIQKHITGTNCGHGCDYYNDKCGKNCTIDKKE